MAMTMDTPIHLGDSLRAELKSIKAIGRMRIRTTLPWWLAVLRRLPGSFKSRALLDRMGLLEGAAWMRFHDRKALMPLDDYDTWFIGEVSNYQINRISNFASICDQSMPDFHFVDGGAHLGMFSAQFAMQSRNVRSLAAIEPNPSLIDYVRANVGEIRIPSEAVFGGLAVSSGRGELIIPDGLPRSHSSYIEPGTHGSVRLYCLDELIPAGTSNLALKLDIEGLEQAVLEGAAETIRRMTNFVLMIELHRDVLERVGSTSDQFLTAIEAVRPLRWLDSETKAPIDRGRDVWDQVGSARQCDLIGISVTQSLGQQGIEERPSMPSTISAATSGGS